MIRHTKRIKFDFEQVRKKWTIKKKSPLDVEYTSGGIFNAKKLSRRPSVRMKYGINPSV